MSSLLSKQSSLNSKSRCRVLICLHSCVCIEWHAPFSLVLFVMSRSTCKKAEHGEVAGLFIPSSFVFIFFPFLPQCFQWWFNGYIFFLLHKQKCWGSQCLSKASIANLESLSVFFSLFLISISEGTHRKCSRFALWISWVLFQIFCLCHLLYCCLPLAHIFFCCNILVFSCHSTIDINVFTLHVVFSTTWNIYWSYLPNNAQSL